MPGATNAILRLTEVQPSQAGAYSVVVSNAFGATSTRGAQLTLWPFVITIPPRDQASWPGGSATFDVTVQSVAPVSYQWRFNGTNLPGATNASLRLAQVQPGDSGPYSVTVSNAFGVATSTPATLTVGLASLVAWGNDFYGQTNVPATLAEVLTIAAGYYHTLALTADGTVRAWGNDASGQTEVPPGLKDVIAIAAGWGHSVALEADGTVIAWGEDGSGQTEVPPDLTDVVAIAAGWAHTLALKADGTVVAWGWNAYGQANVPPGLAKVVAIAAGHSHSLALKDDGTVVAWGDDSFGESDVPRDLANVSAMAAGWNHSLARKTDGSVVAWGWNAYGQANVPPELTNVIAVSAGREHSLALRADGAVVAWGGDSYDQAEVPPGLPPAVAIAAGGYHNFVLLEPVSAPRLSRPCSQDGAFSVSFWTFLRQTYALEAATSFAETNWLPVAVFPGRGAFRTVTDTNTDSARKVYRIRVQ